MDLNPSRDERRREVSRWPASPTPGRAAAGPGGSSAGVPNRGRTPTPTPLGQAHLMPKLVAREAEHDQAPGPEAPLQVIHLGVVPDSCASERCHILNEQHLAPKGPQVHGLPAGQRTRREGVHRARGRCSQGGRRALSGTHGVGAQKDRAEPRTRRTRGAGKRLLLTGGRPRSCGSGTFPAAPTPLPRSVPPHPASVLRLWSREAGGCGRAGCGHRPDRAEARTRLVPPRERSAGTVAVARIIQPRAQAEEGSGFLMVLQGLGPGTGRLASNIFRCLWPHSPPSLCHIPTPRESALLSGAEGVMTCDDGAVSSSCQGKSSVLTLPGSRKVKLEEGGQCWGERGRAARAGLQKPAVSNPFPCILGLP